MKKLYIATVCVIFFLAFFIRFYNVDKLPNGLNQDETALGYNAYLILQTGKDEYGHVLPLYFKSFGDYKLPVYVYLTAGAIKVFGLTSFAVRFWSTLLGSCTVISLFFLVLYLSRKKSLALVSVILLSVNPWHVFFSRVALEVNIANFFLVTGVLLLLIGVQKKRMFVLLFSLLLFGLSLYSYNVTRLVSPILVGFLAYIFWKDVQKFRGFWKLMLSAFVVLLVSPFVLTLFTHSGFSMQKNVLIFGGESQAGILQFRSYLAILPMPLIKLLFNNVVLWGWAYIRNCIGFFSPTFFFLQGGNFSVSVGNIGMFYPFELLTILTGIVVAYKKTNTYMKIFLGWICIVVFVTGLSANPPHATRDFVIVCPLIFFSALGFLTIISFIKSKKMVFQKVFFTTGAIFIGYSVLYFAVSYTQYFSILGARTWRQEDKQISLALGQIAGDYDQILIDSDSDYIYSSLLFYQKYPAQQFLETSQHESDLLFIRLRSVGKYTFTKIDWTKASTMKHTLFVVNGTTQVPSSFTVVATYQYPQRHIVLAVDNTYAQYPIDDVAYRIYKN